MNKISFEEWKNSMSFLIDDEFDNSFLGSIDHLTKFLNQSTDHFLHPSSLEKFLTSKTQEFDPLIKLKAIISLIGLSEERLKRVVSLVRYQFNDEEFSTEWDVKRICNHIQKDSTFRDLIVEFFINGRNSKIGQFIPLYYMRNFKLRDKDFLKDLTEFSYVNRILNDSEIQGKYANEVGAHVERLIRRKLLDYKAKNPTLIFDEQKEFALLNKNIDFLIPSVTSPIILIESSYNITTGSGQSKRADQLVEMFGILMKHNANNRRRPILMINYCDGFGWVGRQNDLHRIYDASDFVINQRNLNILDDILDEYYI